MSEKRLTGVELDAFIGGCEYVRRKWKARMTKEERIARELKAAREEIEILSQSISEFHEEIVRLEAVEDGLRNAQKAPYVEVVYPKGDE